MSAEPDSSLAALDASSRASVAKVWRARAESERKSSAVFGNLRSALAGAHADPLVQTLAEQAISDELRHVEICASVAERYSPTRHPTVRGSSGEGARSESPPATPVFRGCDQRENTVLFAALQCCLSETVAVAFLKTCMERAEGPLVRNALRALLRDEVTHSRIGWAHLASDRVGARERSIVAAAMPELLSITARLWLADADAIHANAPPGHGTLPNSDVRVVLGATVEAIVIPGLEHVGVASQSASEWLRAF